jgi:outer membrane protein
MKRLKSLLLATVLCLGTSYTINAQAKTAHVDAVNLQTKIAHVDFQEILMKMPATIEVKSQLSKLEESYKAELKTMYDEYQNKIKKYDQESATVGDAVNATRQTEVQDLTKRIQDYEQNIQKEMSNKQDVLVKPLLDKVKASISKVGKAKGYLYVIDINNLLLADGPDLTADVKKDLGF